MCDIIHFLRHLLNKLIFSWLFPDIIVFYEFPWLFHQKCFPWLFQVICPLSILHTLTLSCGLVSRLHSSSVYLLATVGPMLVSRSSANSWAFPLTGSGGGDLQATSSTLLCTWTACWKAELWKSRDKNQMSCWSSADWSLLWMCCRDENRSSMAARPKDNNDKTKTGPRWLQDQKITMIRWKQVLNGCNTRK